MELLHSPVVACAVHGTCCGSLLTPCCICSTTSVQRLQYHVCSSAPHPRRPPPLPLCSTTPQLRCYPLPPSTSILQSLGLEVRSVLAIGGIGGLAIGLAGREICENLLNGFLLMTTVRAHHTSGLAER